MSVVLDGRWTPSLKTSKKRVGETWRKSLLYENPGNHPETHKDMISHVLFSGLSESQTDYSEPVSADRFGRRDEWDGDSGAQDG